MSCISYLATHQLLHNARSLLLMSAGILINCNKAWSTKTKIKQPTCCVTMSITSLLRTPHLSQRPGLLECRCILAAVVHVPARGKRLKFGGITRDPYQDLKRKLAYANAAKVQRVPLMSRERREQSLAYPYTVSSAGSYILLVT